VRAHSAGAVREVPGAGGRLPQQRPRPAAEPVPEGRAERGRQVQEDRVASLITAHQLPLFQQSVIARPLPYVYSSAPQAAVSHLIVLVASIIAFNSASQGVGWLDVVPTVE
jgi:hypothetical protein